MKRPKHLLLACAAMALSAGAAHAQTTWSVASGVDYSSGDYGGAEDTTVTSVPLALRVTNGPWTARVSTAWLQVDGPADVADVDGGETGGTVVRDGSESGIGDVNVSVARRFRHLGGPDSAAYFEATARVRLPTGDEDKGLGVGATDYGLGGELGYSRRGNGASVELTRRFLGDRDGVERQDGWQVNTSAWMRATERTSVGAFAYWREASIDGNDDPAMAGAYVSHRLNENVRVSFNASAGLSDGSPDVATGLRFTWRPGESDR